MKPFLKWAGGKYRLVPTIRALLPPGRRLIEPFVGSAAVFLGTDYPTALLGDANPDLINVYRHLQDGGEVFIGECAALFDADANCAEIYFRRREQFNASCDPLERARLFVYLNKHCYNGLCRYSRTGRFNVPFGRYCSVAFPEVEMRAFARRASTAEFVCAPYGGILELAGPGDVVYCDPPYVPLSATANFTAYSALAFGAGEQKKLAEDAARAAQRGAIVLISNHDTPETRGLYRHATQIRTVEVRRNISRDGATRGLVSEILALYLPSVAISPTS